jgi:4-amino-4-deoxy-L-arabinose transferase-like glycosyltransferase
MTKIQKFILILILFCATLLRLVSLDKIPPNLSNDEISIAYDAYSLLKTQRDWHGQMFPVSFQSHNTYKAPLTIYLVIPFTALLGNNEYSVRLPSAILGILTIIILFFLTRELTKNNNLALVTSFVLAFSPWHIYCSRMALESNIALFFVTAGIYFFIKGVNAAKLRIILFSFIFFALSLYAYHTEWIFTPLIISILIIIYFKNIAKKSIILIAIILFAVLVSPLIRDSLNNMQTNARANTEIIFKEPTLENVLKRNDLNVVIKSSAVFLAIFGNYSQYTSINHLFINGLNLMPRNDPFQIGLFYLFFLPGLLVGLFKISEYYKGNAIFIYIWVLIGPLVGSITINAPNIIRNLVSVVPYSIVIASGNYFLWQKFKNIKLFRSLIAVLFLGSVFYFSIIYYHDFSIASSEGFQYGYKQMAQYLLPNGDKYQKIIVDPKFGEAYLYDGLPHYYLPYYLYFDPKKFLSERKISDSGLFFEKYEFRRVHWENEIITAGTLYIVPSSNKPLKTMDSLDEVFSLNLLNGKQAFVFYTRKE